MGPIRALKPSCRTTSAWWKSTWLALALVGCQDPRPPEPPPAAPAPVAAPTVATAASSPTAVSAVTEVDGRTQLTLIPGRKLQVGNALHVRDGKRLVATALVTSADEAQAQALVVALSDRRRPVQVDDWIVVIGSESPLSLPVAQPETPPSAAAIAPPVVAIAPAVAAIIDPPVTADPHAAPVQSTAVLVGAAPTVSEASTADTTATTHHPLVEPAPASAADHPSPATSDEVLIPEVRARLDAERAYWELAARVLRLPPTGPELGALQERLRHQIVTTGIAP